MFRNKQLKLFLPLVLSMLVGTNLFSSEEQTSPYTNFWPIFTHRDSDEFDRRAELNILGPIFGNSLTAANERILSIRPLFTGFEPEAYRQGHFHVVYPIFNFYQQTQGWSWHFLNLVSMRRNSEFDATNFQVFPFLFYNRTTNPKANYYAFWPIGGVLKNRLFRDRIEFALWPLYVQTVRGDETRTHTPWPFIQRLSGPESKGFGFWPFYGHFERENSYDKTWAAWPFYYNYKENLDEEVPYERFGILPFYHRETGLGLKSESYLWPFFGYTKEFAPRPLYNEIRYFWPFIVQGRGEEKYVNRLLPLYANEERPNYQKRWYLWPLLKTEDTSYGGFRREKTSLLYFLYWDEKQFLQTGQARKTFLWPLMGYWNDGNGRKQFQTLDPLSVFFRQNEKIRENWTPLFSLYRYDSRYGDSRHAFLWDLIVIERGRDDTGAFYLGPLFEYVNDGATGHWGVLKGLIGVERAYGERTLRFFWR
jgi:hypothetical protein